MGNRIIISEEEKKNILLLYEENNVVPPSESVFVDNKNPFKYSQYSNARKEYSPDLKNGDLFYIFDKTKFNEHQKVLATNQIKDKTVKIPSLDIIKKVKSVSFNEKGFIWLSFEDGDSWVFIDGAFKVKRPNEIGYSSLSSNEYKDAKMFIDYCKSIAEDYMDKLTMPHNMIEQIDDEFFKIYKIQKQKTDF